MFYILPWDGMYFSLTTSVLDGAVESDSRSPTDFKSNLKKKELRKEVSFTTGALVRERLQVYDNSTVFKSRRP